MEPRFCPNPDCPHHHQDSSSHPNEQFWVHNGFYHTAVVGPVARFKCTTCGRGFSERTFSLDYYTKKSLDNHEIFRAIGSSESLASIARHLSCSAESVQNRLDRIGRNSIACHTRLCSALSLCEDLAADGFESFDRSQFFPNNINILVGVNSQFLYGATHTTIRRKGRMTDKQKEIRAELEKTYKAPRKGIEQSFARLLTLIPAMWDRQLMAILHIRTDEHSAYQRAIQRVTKLKKALEEGSFVHETYSSKLERTVLNPLFSVNYYDRELRKDLAAFRRETTCFTRNVGNGLLRFMAHLVWHNYCKDYRVERAEFRGITHAEVAGMSGMEVERELRKLFGERAFRSREKLADEWERIWMKGHKTPLKDGREYVPYFASVNSHQPSGV